MKRSTLNFIIDLFSFLNLLVLACTGSILKFILPPGSGGGGGFGYRGGRGPAAEIKTLWSMTRHEWGDVHFYFAVLFVTLMLVHLVLHWTWIKCYIRSLFGSKNSTRTNDSCP
jgi:hypothetical protein